MIAPLVQALTEEMADRNPGLEFAFCGSWRRGAPEVGDVDILVISESQILPTLFDPGVALPPTVRWDRVGPRIANGELTMPDGPLHLDVWQALPRSRGAMLAFTTGPAALNTHMRARAKRMGLSLSQDALADRRTGQQLDDNTEPGIFRMLGMEYLTPQQRQGWARR